MYGVFRAESSGRLPKPQMGQLSVCRSGPLSRTSVFDIQMEELYSSGMSNRTPDKADVLQGTLDLMVLQTLSAMGPMHGYQIAGRLEQVSAQALQLNMGTLYPALMRLEQRGYLRAAWGVTDNNRKARFYNMTAAGRRRLTVEKLEWDRMVSVMNTLFEDPA